MIKEEVIRPCSKILGMTLGWVPFDRAEYEVQLQSFNEFLGRLNNDFLRSRTFLVGWKLTIADVVLASYLVIFYRFLLEAGCRQKLESLSRHFDFMINQKAFKKVVGRVWLCEEALYPLGYKDKF